MQTYDFSHFYGSFISTLPCSNSQRHKERVNDITRMSILSALLTKRRSNSGAYTSPLDCYVALRLTMTAELKTGAAFTRRSSVVPRSYQGLPGSYPSTGLVRTILLLLVATGA